MMERYGRFSGGLLTRRYGVFRWLSVEPLLALAAGVLLAGVSVVAPGIGLATIAVVVGAFAAYFAVRTRSGVGAACCLGLLALTAVAWNVGFVRGFLWLPVGGART